MPQPFKTEDYLTVKEIWKLLERRISIRKIYKLIEDGELKPAYRFAGKRGTCVHRDVVMQYKNHCVIEVGV